MMPSSCYNLRSCDIVPELKEITRTDAQKEHIAHHRENIASAVQAQFSDIVEEVRATTPVQLVCLTFVVAPLVRRGSLPKTRSNVR